MKINHEILQFYIYKKLIRRKDADQILEDCQRLDMTVQEYLLLKE